MLARLRLLLPVAIVVLCGTSPIHAQQPVSRDSAPQAGPRLETSATAMKRLSQPLDNGEVLQRRNQNVGQPVALMIVGGAAILIGALIGDDVGAVFMIGGAVALLIGLYKYLN